MPNNQLSKKTILLSIKQFLFPAISIVFLVFVTSYISSLIYLNFSTIVSFIDELFVVTPEHYTATACFAVLLIVFMLYALYQSNDIETSNTPIVDVLVGVSIITYIALLVVITRSTPEGEMTALQLSIVITAYFPVIAFVLLIIYLLCRGK
tara:strand:+ start:1724 stop:2176 length:453 start_codon:yes stop_codon:yes gene_type:complete